MASIRWRLAEVLEAEGLTGYALSNLMAKHADRARIAAVYRMTNEKKAVVRVDLNTLAAILAALRAHSGKAYTVADLLVYEEGRPGGEAANAPTPPEGA